MGKTQTLVYHSTMIACRSNANAVGATDLHMHRRTLYRHANGKYYLLDTAIACDYTPRWITKDEAVDWIVSEARCAISGYGYTREQAALMVNGIDAGRGQRRD